jgi:hypothetical protein
MHSPLPSTPLSIEFSLDVRAGFRRAFDVTGVPAYMETLEFNGYAYRRMAPFDDDPSVRAAVAMRDDEARTGRILEIWDTEYRPEVEALTRATLARSVRKVASRLSATSTRHAAGAGWARFACSPRGRLDGGRAGSSVGRGERELPGWRHPGVALWDLSREAARPEVAAVLGTADWRQISSSDGGGDSHLLGAFLLGSDCAANPSGSLLPDLAEDPSFALFFSISTLKPQGIELRVCGQAVRRREAGR